MALWRLMGENSERPTAPIPIVGRPTNRPPPHPMQYNSSGTMPHPPRAAAPTAARRSRVDWRQAGLAYLLLLPGALVLGAFGFYPLLSALALSLRARGPAPGGFVGLANYAFALREDGDFWRALGVTV